MIPKTQSHSRRHARSLEEPRSQHFLHHAALVCDLVRSMHIPYDRPVLEIGAGTGAITAALADAGLRVIAIEKDVRLYRALRSRFIGRTNVECHHADFLAMPLLRELHTVVSNVPYAITSALVRRVFASGASDAHLIVQREAAEKLTGRPATTLTSLLSEPWFEMEIVRALRREDFRPPPSVESVLLRIHRRDAPLVRSREAQAYREFVLRTFGARRQRARDALRLALTERQMVRLMRDLGIGRDARPSQIAFPQWLAMFRFHAHGRLSGAPRCGRYRNMSRSAGRISSLIAPPPLSNETPRTMATGTRSSLPCTSSAAAASSSTTAICVTRSS